jgi:hypothetical protein
MKMDSSGFQNGVLFQEWLNQSRMVLLDGPFFQLDYPRVLVKPWRLGGDSNMTIVN